MTIALESFEDIMYTMPVYFLSERLIVEFLWGEMLRCDTNDTGGSSKAK